jgi:transcriptional regulator with GAF, ATPase, and Fis domain
MPQKMRSARVPPQPLPEHLITGNAPQGDERLIGGDTGLAAVMARARLVARNNVPVLLFGETGTGKEIIARAIHEHSTYRNGPFRRVNCGAIPSELIDSELFGHEQGAFTGAVARRKGWFEQADGGTLFLDEVGELALAAQVRLLRVVQEGEVVRVGGERPIRVNVRIVAATHRDVPAMVEAQTFREDLYYRLSVFPIVIPPLRDRPNDIRAFAEYFAERSPTTTCVCWPSIGGRATCARWRR